MVRVVSVSYPKNKRTGFYIEPRIRCDTRTRKFEIEVTTSRGKNGPFLSLKKVCIKTAGYSCTRYHTRHIARSFKELGIEEESVKGPNRFLPSIGHRVGPPWLTLKATQSSQLSATARVGARPWE